MQITNKHWVVAGAAFIIAVIGVLLYSAKVPVPASPTGGLGTASTTTSTTTTTVPVTEPAVTGNWPFPVNAADNIVSWSFKGAYLGNDALVQQTTADIAHLTGLLGKGEFADYDLYDGIANDYTSIGDGTAAYQNYNRAIAIHPKNVGLAYANLAHLMDQLGAYHTAADAYKKAVNAEPGMLEYHIERLTYLTRQFPSDNALITAALSDVSKQFGDTAQILTIEAQWLTAQKRYSDAIKAWETVKMLSPGKDTSAIDAEIIRLRAKQ